MERRKPGQAAAEHALAGVPPWMVKLAPGLTRAIGRTVPEARSWLEGEAGEKKAAAVVNKIVAKVGGDAIYDVQLDKENIDIVAVLPTGIFIIEVKNWTGRVGLKGDVMFHGGREPRRVHAQVVRQRRKLVEQLGLTYDVEGVIVFASDELTVSGKRAPDSTPIVWLGGLAEHLLGTRKQPRPAILAPYEVRGLATTVRYGRPLVMTAIDGL